jgi:hypothetical protein
MISGFRFSLILGQVTQRLTAPFFDMEGAIQLSANVVIEMQGYRQHQLIGGKLIL